MGFMVAEARAAYGVEAGAKLRLKAPGKEAKSGQGELEAGNPLHDLSDVDPSAPIPESLDELATQITTLAARIHAATHRMLTLLAAFDGRRGWKAGGHRSCAHWLHVETGIALGAAREKVRTARALVGMPVTSEAMERGELSFSKVRALTRVAPTLKDKSAETQLVDRAREQTTAQVEKMVRGWKHLERVDEAELERHRHASRTLSITPDGGGMYRIRGKLPAEVGAVLMRAVEAAGDALFREEWRARDEGPPAKDPPSEVPEVTPAQRRADAMGLLSERALAAGFGVGEAVASSGVDDKSGAGDGDGSAVGDESKVGQESGPGDQPGNSTPPTSPDTPNCSCARAPLSGTRAERYHVILHVDEGTLQVNGDIGRANLEDGTRVSAETARRLSCDAGVIRAHTTPDGHVLDVGRRTRTIPPAIRRALQIRDGGCRFPGCGLRFTEAHHIVHWADGGTTSLPNLVLLCRHHHRLIHEDGFQLQRSRSGQLRFLDPNGKKLGTRRHATRNGTAHDEARASDTRRNGAGRDGNRARPGREPSPPTTGTGPAQDENRACTQPRHEDQGCGSRDRS